MRPELEAQILGACPILFRGGLKRGGGVECEDGWFAILEELSLGLEAICMAWAEGDEPPMALQVKEKFGGLRFYVTKRSPEMTTLIQMAVEACDRTCEICGHPGDLVRIRNWYRTLCPACEQDVRHARARSRDEPE